MRAEPPLGKSPTEKPTNGRGSRKVAAPVREGVGFAQGVSEVQLTCNSADRVRFALRTQSA